MASPDGPVKLVEVPLVDQEPINAAERARPCGRAEAGRNEIWKAVRSVVEQTQADPVSMITSEDASA